MSSDEFKPADEHPYNRLRIAQDQHIIPCPSCDARYSDRLPACPECGAQKLQGDCRCKMTLEEKEE